MSTTTNPTNQQSNLFLSLYALAWAGGSVAYVPFLTILLPERVADLSGESAVSWLAYISFVGAIAASLANIGFGWLSDLAKNRRMFVSTGLVLSCGFLLTVRTVETLVPLLVVIAAWQFSLNMMLAPLAAWAGDCVPDNQKGQLGGLLSIAPAAGAMAGTFVTHPGFADGQGRLWLVAAIVAACVLPALIIGRPRRFPELLQSSTDPAPGTVTTTLPRSAVVRMWFARLLIQIAEVALFAYLLLWIRTLSETVTDNHTAWIYSVALFIGIPAALLAGRWADQRDRPIMPLVVCTAIVATGLLLMGTAWSVGSALAGYFLFGIAGAVFLSLHTAQTLRVLPRPERRGRDLGLFNLTNTVPALIMPWLTLLLVPVFGFSGLFYLLAALALLAFAILFTMPRKS